MKKFKFKLEALLKLREFAEKQKKLELGKVLREIADVKDYIEKLKQDIQESYEAQEQFLANPAAGQMIQFFPFFIKSKNDEIKNQQTLLKALENKFEDKSRELALARGEAKVIEKLKEKHHDKYKKQILKNENQQLEEIVMAKRHREKGL